MKKFIDELDCLVDLIININNKEDLKNLFMGLLTLKEINEISTRLEIINRLLNGETQHKIAHELKIGVATVSRGSKALKEGYFKVLHEGESTI